MPGFDVTNYLTDQAKNSTALKLDTEALNYIQSASEGNHEAVLRYVERLNKSTELFLLALSAALSEGHNDCADAMLKTAGYQSLENAVGEQLLDCAVRLDFANVVELLISKGAKIDGEHRVLNIDYLDVAIEVGSDNVVAVLLNHNASVCKFHENNKTYLHRAAELGHYAIAKALLDHDHQVDALDDNSRTALHYVVTYYLANKHKEEAAGNVKQLIDLLCKRGADVDACDAYGKTALMLAVTDSALLPSRKLLALGANPNYVACEDEVIDSENSIQSPLSCALQNALSDEWQQAATMLLDNGADIHLTFNGTNALLQSVRSGNEEGVAFLMMHGASCDGNILKNNDIADNMKKVMIRCKKLLAQKKKLTASRGQTLFSRWHHRRTAVCDAGSSRPANTTRQG